MTFWPNIPGKAEVIQRDSGRDFFMTAEAAKEYNIVDQICLPLENQKNGGQVGQPTFCPTCPESFKRWAWEKAPYIGTEHRHPCPCPLHPFF